MSVPEGFSIRAATMKLPLHCSGDHDDNAFPISSSSPSSSSSSSCPGAESSPESLRRLSSLSGGRPDSPPDYDAFEVTLVKTDMMMMSNWAPHKEEEDGETVDKEASEVKTPLSNSNDNNVISTGKTQLLDCNDNNTVSTGKTQLLDSRDNDAVSTGKTQLWDCDNDAVSMGRTQLSNSSDNDEVSAGKTQSRVELSESNDNSVYVDANSDDYHQDSWNDNRTLALSLTLNGDLSSSSGGGGRRCGSSTPDSATEIPADDDEDESVFVSVSSEVMLTSSANENAGICNERTVFNAIAAEDGGENTPLMGSKPAQPNQILTAVATKTKHASSPKVSVKPTNQEPKRVSRVDLKTMKAKVGSRANSLPPKTPNKTKPSPSTGKRPILSRDDPQSGDGGRKRQSAAPVRATVVLRPIGGQNGSPRNNQRPEEKSGASISRTLSTSTSSVGSEGAADVKNRRKEDGRGGAVENPQTPTRLQFTYWPQVALTCRL
ncbi:uncharacterized protein KZ484_024426 [Pholidichthys leucotaenia]